MSMGPLYVLGEVSIYVLCPFFNWIICLPGVELYEFFIFFGDQTFVQCIIGKYIFPYGQFHFHLGDDFFSHAEAFKFDVVPFVSFFLYIPCPRRSISKNSAVWESEILLPVFSSRTFMVSQLMFSNFIHCEFILVYGVSWWS